MLAKIHIPNGAPYFINSSVAKGVFPIYKGDIWTSVKVDENATDSEIISMAYDNIIKRIAEQEYDNIKLYKNIFVGSDVMEIVK